MLEPLESCGVDPVLAAGAGGVERAHLARSQGRDVRILRSSSFTEAIDIPRLKIEFIYDDGDSIALE